MGINYNNYIGPYLKTTSNIAQKEIDLCSNHNVPKDAIFCPKCGRENNFRYTGVVVVIDEPEDLIENIHDDIYCVQSEDSILNGTRTRLFLPNRYWDKLGVIELITRQELSFDSIDIEKSKKMFLDLFDEHIKYLQQWSKVEVKYGYISYTN